MKRLLFITIILLSFASALFAAPYHGQVQSFKQPDGSSVDVKLYGTEFYMRAEGMDGYTVIRDPKTNTICYAKLSEDKSELISTGIIYKGVSKDNATLRNDLGLQKHLDISKKAIDAAILKSRQRLGMEHSKQLKFKTTNTPVGPLSGQIKGLCIVVDFSDEVGTLPMSEFVNFCNDLNYTNFGNNGSLRRFYSDISGGLLDYENIVYGYYRAPLTFAQYDAMPYAQGAQQILGLALAWVDAQGFDFSTLTLNPDSSIMAINLMYTGTPMAWAQGMWHHQGYYSAFAADGVHTGAYNCSPAGSPLHLAVVAHENGHMIGKWPDTYKYDGVSLDGIGSFDLMCWYGDYFNPVPPNPLFRSNVGWGKVVDVTNFNGIISDTANSSTCYRYTNINDTNEFYLLESRMATGRSSFIPDEGLTIWHIDRGGDNQTAHHEVWLEHADNIYNNEDDACFRSSLNDQYSYGTVPSSQLYDGNPSGLKVWDISGPGSVMTYKLGLGQAGPSLTLHYKQISGDNNGNGFLEPGETGNIDLDASNWGQLNSANASVICTMINTNPAYVTINTPASSIGVINVAQTKPVAVNLSIASNTPLGTDITLKFLLTDGADTIFVTKKIVVGETVLMDFATDTTCGVVFYDDGGNGNYQTNASYTKTFYPGQAGQPLTVNFLSFDMEADPNCAFDYLDIYDGPDDQSPLLGRFCGNIIPGPFTATGATGTLTFKSISDGAVSANGWKAVITCPASTGVSNVPKPYELQISPNPSTGIFKCRIDATSEVSVIIADMFGRDVYHAAVANPQEFHVDLSGLPNGIYFLKANVDASVITRKIILSR